MSGSTTIEHGPSRYLRSPRLVREGGEAALYCIGWLSAGEQIVRFGLDASGRVVSEEPTRAAQNAIGGLDLRNPALPTDDPALDRQAVAQAWSVRVEHPKAMSRVLCSTPAGKEVVVWEARGLAAAPALAPLGDSAAWLAFHHDVREDSRQQDISKWIEVLHVSADGTVQRPLAPMCDRDRDRHGEEQSFEFPTLVVGLQGALSIYGRGSHCFWRQDLDAEGFSPRHQFGEGGWGCRGRRVTAVLLDDGSVLTARREKRGIVVQRMAAPAGRAPALSRAESEAPVEVEARRPFTGSDASFLTELAQEGRLCLFGDLHQHSAHSDGIGTAEEAYLRARDTYGDDFCALTDHESFLGKRIGPGEWAHLQAVADAYDEPGRFATLIAYEWTGRMHPGPGHKVVYLPRSGLPIVSRDEVPDGAELVRRAKELGGFAAPHHIGWTGANVEAHDAEGQPVWEICSCHGCYESCGHVLGQRGELTEHMIDEMLKRKLRFGFIGSSDSHGLLWHHGVARKRDPFRTGLAAVQATERTRQSVFEALRTRRCYATSGVKMALDLRANGQPMGSTLHAEKVEVVARVQSGSTIDRIELVGPDGVMASAQGRKGSAQVRQTLRLPFVFARAVQADGEMAWSSPVFFE